MLKKALTHLTLLLATCTFGNGNALAENKFSDLTILVSSCDKYSNFWDPFFMALFKEWPSLTTDNQELPIKLVANSKKYPNPRVETINIENETSWSDNILAALQQVNTKYVLLFLEDYWLNQPVKESRLYDAFQVLKDENGVLMQVSGCDHRYNTGPKYEKLAGINYRKKYSHYKASLQLVIWDKDALQFLLKPGENPWEFELAGTLRSHGYPGKFFTIVDEQPITYTNAAHQGFINPSAVTQAKVNNFPFEYDKAKVLGKFNPKLKYHFIKQKYNKFLSFLKHPGSFYEFEY